MTLELSQTSLAWLFLISFIMGFVTGFLYDFMKLRRRYMNLGNIIEIVIISIEDLLFFLCWGVAFCILLYALTFGVVRIEAIILQLLGFLVYRKTFSKLFEKISEPFIRPVKNSLEKLKIKRNKKLKKHPKRKDCKKNERTR